MNINDIYINGKLNSELLKKEKWLYYLTITDNDCVNRERVDSISGIKGTETLEYVLRTLDVLDRADLDSERKDIIRKVLQWSEVAKGGTKRQREIWESKGYPLDIHNLASAEIYLENSTDSVDVTNLVYMLIKTHGIIGQNIRGEVNFSKNMPLIGLIAELKAISKPESENKNYSRTWFYNLLSTLNKCIISAVSTALWENVKYEVCIFIQSICDGKLLHDEARTRMDRLLPELEKVEDETVELFNEKIFPYFELWYFTSALSSLSSEQINVLMNRILQTEGIQKAQHINFKPMADALYYDYEGKKNINVYKQRVIETFLKCDVQDNKDVKLDVNIVNGSAMVSFKFSPACEKLIDFCVEAEKTGLLAYEKSINMLFDMFGFKRDQFDRLNNENKYLSTMNDCAESKRSIFKEVKGYRIVDVGSGGGVMLDLLEEKYPDKMIIGTDISSNVIEELKKKKKKEDHNWNVVEHNFVDSPLSSRVDTIIFSSILHEIFSYTNTGKGKFDIESVKIALKNAYNSLNVGGRIIIRDGIKTGTGNPLEFKFKNKEDIQIFDQFAEDFKGLKDIYHGYSCDCEGVISADVDFAREFLYTYTWGTDSYAHEVQEQFGYMTLNEFKDFFMNELNAKIIKAEEFLEDGYYEHLKDKIELDKKDYPNSNCIIIVEKSEEF